MDTVPFYIGVKYLGRYLHIDPTIESGADAEAVGTAGPSGAKRPGSGP